MRPVRPGLRTSALPAAEESHHWRFLDTGSLDGVANMALDEALLLSFDSGRSLPILRLYGWQPPALSLGRFQDAAAVLDLEYCRAAGVPLVRRITGGGVIYHADELTYSIVCAPRHLPSTTSIKESFRHLTAFLLLFYAKLGLDPHYAADYSQGRRLGERTPFCFAGQESYDILIQEKKIGGNAQKRLKEVIFQHGSIPLLNRAETGGTFMQERPDGIGEQTTSLGQEGVMEDEVTLKSLLKESFQERMGVLLQETTLTMQEKAMSEELRGKYRDDGWNLRGETV
jgi:lipoyl(octanoyl) transferase